MSIFSSLREWVTFAADICILLITIYTFYITFISKRIKFLSIPESLSITNGDNFSVVLENKSLSPLVIEDIHLIVDNTYKVQVKKFESPLVLEPYAAQKVTSDRYSYTVPTLPPLIGNKTVLEVKTSGKKLYLRLHKKVPRVTTEMRNIPYNVSKVTNTYNEKVVPKGAQFVLVASKEDWNKTVFIFKTGVMTGEILGYNGIPEEFVKDQESLLRFLDTWLKPNGVNYYADQLTNSFIQESVSDYQSAPQKE